MNRSHPESSGGVSRILGALGRPASRPTPDGVMYQLDKTGGSLTAVDPGNLSRELPRPRTVVEPLWTRPGKTRIMQDRRPPPSLQYAIGDWATAIIAGGDNKAVIEAVDAAALSDLQTINPPETWIIKLSGEDSVTYTLTQLLLQRQIPHESRRVLPSEMLTVPEAVERNEVATEILLATMDTLTPAERTVVRNAILGVTAIAGSSLSEIKAGLGRYLDISDKYAQTHLESG